MKKSLPTKILTLVMLLTLCYYGFDQLDTVKSEDVAFDKQRADFNLFLDQHPYSSTDLEVDMKSIAKKDRPDLAMQQNYFMIVDPNTLTVPYNKLVPAYNYTKQMLQLKGGTKPNFKPLKRQGNTVQKPLDDAGVAISVGGNDVVWEERGPDNVGGRTRTILWDPNDPTNRRVFTGGVAGGLWVNDNVLDANSSWRAIDDFLANLAITSLTADPNNSMVFYAGTGEGWFNSDAVRGAGIFQSLDGGETWNLLPSTNGDDFAYVQKVVVTSTGTILAATRAVNSTDGGIFRSDDDGTTFTRVLQTRGADIEVAANGDIYASRGIFSAGTIFKSTDDGVNWSDVTPSNVGNANRIEIATAPSDANILYAVAHSGTTNATEWTQRSSDAGVTWTNLTTALHNDGCAATATDITRNQAWYDLILAVSPINPDVVLLGGVVLGRSEDGGQTWTQISEWFNCSGIEDVHADQHGISFRPGNPNEALFGHDGGISYSPNVGAAFTPTFENRNKNYSVTQFYAVATDNVAGSDYYIAGAQDNGTQQLRADLGASAFEVIGGDGAFAHVDQLDRNFQVGSTQNGGARHSFDGGQNFSGLSTIAGGNFINQTDYDNAAGILYSTAGPNQIARNANLKSSSPAAAVALSFDFDGRQSSAILANTNTANRIFVGTEGGLIFRIDDANAATPTATDITSNITSVGNVSSIDVGTSDMELIATYSNFGVTSVWYTTDGGANWINKDDTGFGLPDMPIRWALFNPNNTQQVLLATELGVWSTNDITAANPGWEPSNEGLANVRCDMIQYREADGLIVVATHGRGLFTSNIFEATGDTDGPIATVFTPADDEPATQPLDLNLEIQFDEPVKIGTGNIIIRLVSDDSQVESIAVTSDQVSTTATRAIINPIADLLSLTDYYIEVDAGAFTDNFDNPFTGIADKTTWNFTTFDGDLAPVVNIPITDINVSENSDDIVVDLANVFNDVDSDNSAITFEVVNGSNASVVTSNLVGSDLTLSFVADKIGSAQFTVTATSNGKTIDDVFSVTVNSTAQAIFVQTGANNNGQAEGVYNDITFQNADDIVVPEGQNWEISTLTTEAFYLGGVDLDLQNVDVIIFNNDAGTPGTIAFQQTVLPNQGQIIGGVSNNPSLTIRLNSIITLSPGTYWVSILPTFNANAQPFGGASAALYAWFQSGQAGNSFQADGTGVFEPIDQEMLFTIDGEIDIFDFAPEVANAIDDVSVLQNSDPITIDLTNTFTDPDGDDNAITIEVIDNSNDGIVTTSFNNTRELLLTLVTGVSGTADITLRATSGALTVEETFNLTVMPLIDNFPYVENFDEDAGAFPEGWNNQAISNLNWLVGTGPTPSGGTGPSGDNTTGTGFYLFTESSTPAAPGDTASLMSPVIDLSSLTTPELRFSYHMFGVATGTLNVNVIPVGTTDTTNVFTISGEQQTASEDPYLDTFVSFGSTFSGQRVRLEFQVIHGEDLAGGNNFRGDIAIDDISLLEQPNNDLVALSIDPANNEIVSGPQDITVVFRNDGVLSQPSFDAELRLNGNLIATETVTLAAPLERGESVTYTFSQQADIVLPGGNEVTATALLTIDEIPDNNSISTILVSENTPFLGEYTMIQLTGGLTFNGGNVFGATGVDFLDIRYVNDSEREFTASPLQSITGGLANFSFTLNASNEVVFGPNQVTGLAGGGNPLLYGTAATPGIYNPNDPSNFTLTVGQDATGAFGGPVDVLFQLFINEAPTGVEIDVDNINEGQPIGSLVGVLSAVDSNPNDRFIWELGGTDAASFTLGGANGNELLTGEVFDAGIKNVFDIDITVTDATGEEFTQNLIIDVNGVVLTAPTFVVSSIGSEDIIIDISDVNGASAFEVDVSTDNFNTFVSGLENFVVIGNQGTISGLNSNTTYNVRVKASNELGFGPFSTTSDVLTLYEDITIAESNITSESFDISFTSPDGATSFEIDISTDGFATFVTGYEGLVVNGSSISVTGLNSNTTYNVRAGAINASGVSGSIPALDVLTLPGDITIADSNVTSESFDISFTAPDGTTSFEIDVSTDGFTTFVTGFENLNVNGSSVSVTGLTSNTVYNVRSRAVNASGNSAYTETLDVSTSPEGITIAESNITSASFDISFTSPDGATSFEIDVSADDFTTFVTGFEDLIVSGSSVTVTGLNSNTVYNVRGRAVNASGNSAYTETLDVLTTPNAPVAEAASDLSTEGFTANWSSNDGATSYLLDISTDNFTTFVTGFEALAVNNTSQVVTLDIGVYQYRVRASNASGESANSNVVETSIEPLGVTSFEVGEVQIFPNPNNGLFQVQLGFELTSELTIEIYSPLGALIKAETFSNSGQNNISIDLREANNGVYLMRISNAEKNGILRFVKN